MSWRDNLRKGRSHLITVAILLAASSVIVRIEDATLEREAHKPPPRSYMEPLRRSLPGGPATRPKAGCDDTVDGRPCPDLRNDRPKD